MKKRITASIFLSLLFLAACIPARQTGSQGIIPIELTISTTAQADTPAPDTTPAVGGLSQSSLFLETLDTGKNACLPEETDQCIGVYVYALDQNQELVSINADVPFMFASAFKGPVLVYFLESCKQYWDVNTPEWNSFYLASNPAYSDKWYVSDEYKQSLSAYLSDLNNWGNIENFAASIQTSVNGGLGYMDERYFILEQVYKMVVESDNYAAGDVLAFIHESCPANQSAFIEAGCGGPNAITEFNQWFNGFANIEYGSNEPQRGLYSWDTITSIGSDGEINETMMATSGLRDTCATQEAPQVYAEDIPALNVWTSRDLYQFYSALFHTEDKDIKNTALGILGVDEDGAATGYMKKMAGKMGATAMNKDGSFGYVLSDAGIIQYQGKWYVIVTLSYDAVSSMESLYGVFDELGNPVGNRKGLLQELLESTLMQ